MAFQGPSSGFQGPSALRDARKKRRGNIINLPSGNEGSLPYPYRLNFYDKPPQLEVSLEEFELWAIDRLRVLTEIETCSFRNYSAKETDAHLDPILKKYIPLNSNSSIPENQLSLGPKAFAHLMHERRKDHYSHFILRLAFARSEELRRRFTRAEAILFRHRFNNDSNEERNNFLNSLDLDSEVVSAKEKVEHAEDLMTVYFNGLKKDPSAQQREQFEAETYLKVDWDRVGDLVESRRVFLYRGKAYVPRSSLLSLVMAEFSKRLDADLIKTARVLPRLDEDDRLIPILNHLSKGFTAPEYNTSSSAVTGDALTAAQIDGVQQHFPLCMRNLHTALRRDKHLKHFGRLQYGLFIKGLGLSVDEAILFWRTSFSRIDDEKFNKEYRYNIRHNYGLQGAGRNYKPYACQQILMEHPPGTGDAHGCPYRHFSVDNLSTALHGMMGVENRSVISGVRQDVEAKKYHLACNRVFEHLHEAELKREKDKGNAAPYRETIIHPNDYFDRSWKLKRGEAGVKTEEEDAPGASMVVRGQGPPPTTTQPVKKEEDIDVEMS